MIKQARTIIFRTAMVRAILDGRKTVTRRVVKAPVLQKVTPPNIVKCEGGVLTMKWTGPVTIGGFDKSAPYRPGDILYVRETWNRKPFRYDEFIYRADGCYGPDMPWRPSIHMPKEAARLFLRVTGVRVQQLKDVTEADARAEGFGSRAEFMATILKMYPNSTEKSWFWVIEFEQITKEEADNG